MPLISGNFRLNQIVTPATVVFSECPETSVIRPAPLPTSRHARLFELIRQVNLAEQRRESQLAADVTAEDSVAFLKRATQTLAMRR